MKKFLFFVGFILIFSACVEQATDSKTGASDASLSSKGGTSITPMNPTTSTQSEKTNYSLSSFSLYVSFHKTLNKALIDYNFFPEGSDLCQQATYNEITNPNGCRQDKTIEIPCEFFEMTENDLLSIGMSAPIEESRCRTNIVVDLKNTEFSVEGLIIPLTNEFVDVFSENFEFYISKEGFVDQKDLSVLSFDSNDVGLSDVYESIADKRTQR